MQVNLLMATASKDQISADNYDRQFPLKIGILNALSFLVIILSVTYVDSHYHNISYGLRHYPWGYLAGLFSIPIFCFTFMINSKKDLKINNSTISKSILTFLGVIVPNVFLNYICFQPEFPHNIIIFGSIIYETIIAFIVYIHNFELKFEFLHDNEIDKNAKIERIKLEYDIWQKLLFALVAGFSVWTIAWLQGLKDVGSIVAIDPVEQEFVKTSITFLIIVGSFFFLMLFSEVAKKILTIRDQLDKIKR
jgi:hypothetical protein